jgi:hypothetical protein
MRVTRTAPARTRAGIGIAAVLWGAAIYGCADPGQATGPAAVDPQFVGLTTTGEVFVLQRTTPLAADVVASKRIGRRGGVIVIPEAGFTFIVPEGALDRDVLISATAVKGDDVDYQFGPHGLRFDRKVQIIQRLEGTNAYQNKLVQRELFAAYYADPSQRDGASEAGTTSPGSRGGDDDDGDGDEHTATVEEAIPVTINRARTMLAFKVEHFSGYLVASGRKEKKGKP